MTNAYPIRNADELPVTIMNEGQSIRAMLHRPASPAPHPAVLMIHGFTGDKTGPHRLFVHAAREFAAAGISTLRFDMRGSGESEGEFQHVTIASEMSDAQAAFDWLVAQPDIDSHRLALLGLSLGGLLESMLAGRNAAKVAGLVYWSAAANTAVLMHMADQTAERNGTSTASLMDSLATNGYVMVWAYPVGLPFIQTFFQQDPLAELQQYAGEALIVHSANDPIVSVSQSDVYREHFGSRATVHILEDNSHTFDNPPVEQAAIQLTVDWLRNRFRLKSA